MNTEKWPWWRWVRWWAAAVWAVTRGRFTPGERSMSAIIEAHQATNRGLREEVAFWKAAHDDVHREACRLARQLPPKGGETP